MAWQHQTCILTEKQKQAGAGRRWDLVVCDEWHGCGVAMAEKEKMT